MVLHAGMTSIEGVDLVISILVEWFVLSTIGMLMETCSHHPIDRDIAASPYLLNWLSKRLKNDAAYGGVMKVVMMHGAGGGDAGGGVVVVVVTRMGRTVTMTIVMTKAHLMLMTTMRRMIVLMTLVAEERRDPVRGRWAGGQTNIKLGGGVKGGGQA